MQNLGIWGTVGGRGSKCVVESAIFRIADLDLPIHYATFMGLQWWLRVVYSWVPPLLSIFSRKTQVLFWAKIWRFGEINRGLKLNLSFITPYGTSLRDFTSFELSRVKIHPRVWPVAWSKKKGICLEAICLEAPSEWISTKFGIRGPLADVINCADFFCRSVQGYWFCGGRVEICLFP